MIEFETESTLPETILPFETSIIIPLWLLSIVRFVILVSFHFCYVLLFLARGVSIVQSLHILPVFLAHINFLYFLCSSAHSIHRIESKPFVMFIEFMFSIAFPFGVSNFLYYVFIINGFIKENTRIPDIDFFNTFLNVAQIFYLAFELAFNTILIKPKHIFNIIFISGVYLLISFFTKSFKHRLLGFSGNIRSIEGVYLVCFIIIGFLIAKTYSKRFKKELIEDLEQRKFQVLETH